MFQQEALFLSEQTLKKELDMLDQQISSQAPVNRVTLPDIEVKDMNSSKLSVEIKVSQCSCTFKNGIYQCHCAYRSNYFGRA